MRYTASCYVQGKLTSGLPVVRHNKRSVVVLVRDGQTGKLKEIKRKIARHKVRLHPSKNALTPEVARALNAAGVASGAK